MYAEMPLYDDYTLDYAEIDAALDEKWRWLAENLPFLTHKEIAGLTNRPDFPGILSDYTALSAFTDKAKRTMSRILDCRVRQTSYTVTARIDIVSGFIYIPDNGRYVLSDLTGYMEIEFAKGKSANIVSTTVADGKTAFLTEYLIQRVVQELEQAKALPSL